MIMGKVNTGRLREGNKIYVDGAVIKLEGKPEVFIGPGGRTWWAWRNMPIISGTLTGLPWAKAWTIQGDGLCFWRVS